MAYDMSDYKMSADRSDLMALNGYGARFLLAQELSRLNGYNFMVNLKALYYLELKKYGYLVFTQEYIAGAIKETTDSMIKVSGVKNPEKLWQAAWEYTYDQMQLEKIKIINRASKGREPGPEDQA
jgi:hypothetical protein